MADISGTLYVVATPIGNLGDFSPRAREVLAQVGVIAAEDTRHTGQLLKAFGIHTPMLSLHEHNEAARAQALIERLTGGESVALVSDAGTPLISDPGYGLVAAARAQGVNVVPGPCAAIAALSIAGLPTDRFTFEGFLPAKSAARRTTLENLQREPRTMVFYESPHRLRETVEDMRAIFGGQRRAVICREITKQFETTYAGTLEELQRMTLEQADMVRGEIVIVVAGSDAAPATAAMLDTDRLLRALLEDLSPSQAAKIAARLSDQKRSALYEQALQLKPAGER
jgi:16S rRNA (cytidine1402-2'-O)-methyltransferase